MSRLTVAITAKPCYYCGSYHSTLCPRVEEIEYHGDGTVKRVRLRDASRCGHCGLRDGDHAVWCAGSQPEEPTSPSEKARLQQALDGIESTLGTMSLNGLTGDQQKAIAESWGMAREKRPDPELVYATDGEALAGPDSQECDHGITLANKQTGVERCAECGSIVPADSQEDKT